MLYLSFPLIYVVVKKMSKTLIQQILILLVLLGVSVVLERWVINNLTTRLCIIVMGVLTYLNVKENRIKELCIVFGVCLLLTFVLQSEMICYSLCVPALLMLLNNIEFNESNIFYKSISFTGNYTFEIYLAQVLTTKYFLTSGLINNVYLMLIVCLLLTIILTCVFYYATKYIKVVVGIK